uniref:DUF418 domain-containing protein n=1 Tax=Flavobacterium sp. TaxID=239 RepID=UPI00286CAE0A
DALRGFAIMCIVILHNMEHFEFYYYPEQLPEWMKILDANLLSTAYFLFGGKAYAIFAILFGFSFYIQNENQIKKGNDFRLRFFWRMMLLLIFGFINTAFYQGDILTLYAILGLILIPFSNLNNKTVFIIATFLLLQPMEWGKFLYLTINPDFIPSPNLSESYYKEVAEYMTKGTFWDYMIGDVTLGKTASVLWSWENGRIFQAPALFLFGMLVGRKQLFVNTLENILFWKKALKIAILTFIPLYFIVLQLPDFMANKFALARLLVIVSSWSNFAFMIILSSSFILLFYTEKTNKLLSKLIPFGKMSLTNYIIQSIIGATLYYKYGFALYQYTGATICLFIGIILFLLNLAFCKWWLKTRRQGPLEYIWHKATWIKF